MEQSNRYSKYGYFFVLPFFLVLFLFVLLPIFFTFYVSFMKWDGFTDMHFVGFENYIEVIKGGLFFKSLYNTLIIMALSLPLSIILSLGLSFILNEKLTKFSGFFKTAFFLPYITTPVAVGLFFSLLCNYQIGFINILLVKLGLLVEPIYWLAKPLYVVLIVSMIVVWKNFGYNMVLYLAGLQTISPELYEAAQIDGATVWRRFLHITVPMLRPITIFVVITTTIWGLQIFEEPALLMVGTDSGGSIGSTLGGPEKAVYTLVSYVYEEGFVLFRPGRSAAVAYLMTFVIIVFSFVSFGLLNRGDRS
ncbi:carbohydrate ABC transporter permease [Cohnella sp. WQ 127256]|uniref:carbohydrate ABC transporter permease n=1 Tax=Cohnella sp. WQ 127256 TaxID=2938790 RepID=UPI00211780CB|nr:sugar ABC transporter permease [Cohnella sp. WQ 127256]